MNDGKWGDCRFFVRGADHEGGLCFLNPPVMV